MWIAIGIGVVFLVWIIKSIWLVGPKEMAVRVILGEAKAFCDSGFRFVAWFFGCYLKKYPKKKYNLDFPAKKVITKAGVFEGKEYGSEVIEVDAVAYVNFPRNNNLIKILESDVPTDEKELLNFVDDSVMAAFRIVGGEMTWREFIQNMEGVIKAADKVFKSEDGALLQAGFEEENLNLVIKEITLPERLAGALLLPDVERLGAEAAGSQAEARAKRDMGAIIQRISQATGKAPEQIQKEIREDAKKEKTFLGINKELEFRRLAAEHNGLLQVLVSGTGGIKKTLVEFLALAMSLPLQKGGEKKETEEKKEKKERTREEKKKTIQERLGIKF